MTTMLVYHVEVIYKNGNLKQIRQGPYFGDWLDLSDAEKIATEQSKKDDVALARVISERTMA
jgi:hypothetical protein